MSDEEFDDFEEESSDSSDSKLSVLIDFPNDDGEFWERTKFTQFDILVGLQQLYGSGILPNEAEDLIRALFSAILGLHPHFRLNVEIPQDGRQFKPFTRMIRHLQAVEIADRIDLAVARGTKLEAEVEAVIAAFGLSRREVFRLLKETRYQRQMRKESAPLFGRDRHDWPLPSGFDIDDNGKIVPADDDA